MAQKLNGLGALAGAAEAWDWNIADGRPAPHSITPDGSPADAFAAAEVCEAFNAWLAEGAL